MLDCVVVLGIHLERLFVVLYRQIFLAYFHVGLAETVIHVRRLRILAHILLEDLDGILLLSAIEQSVTQTVENSLVDGRRSVLGLFQRVVLRQRLGHSLEFGEQEQVACDIRFHFVRPGIFLHYAAQNVIHDGDAVIRVCHQSDAIARVGIHGQQGLEAFIGAVMPELARSVLLHEKAEANVIYDGSEHFLGHLLRQDVVCFALFG